MSSFALKLIAIITMLIDHTGAVLLPGLTVLRIIGRISFPIFCFLLAEGFAHTKNLHKYMLRMLIFVLISEIPHDLALNGTVFSFELQNVFLTLFLGLLAMYGIDRYTKKGHILWAFLPAAAAAAGELLGVEYGAMGVAIMFIFFILRGKRAWALCAFAAANCVMALVFNSTLQYAAVLAVIPLALYNGERGPRVKYFFYAFYPVHLLLLHILTLVLF